MISPTLKSFWSISLNSVALRFFLRTLTLAEFYSREQVVKILLVKLTFVAFVSCPIFHAFSQHRDEEHKDEWTDGSQRRNWRDGRDATQDHYKQEVTVREALELVGQTKRQERHQGVLGCPDVVRLEPPQLVFISIVYKDGSHLISGFIANATVLIVSRLDAWIAGLVGFLRKTTFILL